jgi:hypothetical protein
LGNGSFVPHLAYSCGMLRTLFHTRPALGATRGEGIRRADFVEKVTDLSASVLRWQFDFVQGSKV